MNTKKILYATDFSPGSPNVLRYATWLAHQLELELLIVHVSDAEPYPVGELFDEQPDADPKAFAKLNSIIPDDPGVIYQHRLLFGKVGSPERTKPGLVIVDFARRENVEMIVMGSHGNTGLLRLIMGSVAETIIRNAPCPVLTVHLARDAQTATKDIVLEKTGVPK